MLPERSPAVIAVVERAQADGPALPPAPPDLARRMQALGLAALCHPVDWHPDAGHDPNELLASCAASGWLAVPSVFCWRIPRLGGGVARRLSPDESLPLIRAVFDRVDAATPRFDGRPMLLLFDVDRLSDAAASVQRWRADCRARGIGEIAVLAVQLRWHGDARRIGCDAALAWPPFGLLRDAGAAPADAAPANARPSDTALPDPTAWLPDYRAMAAHRLKQPQARWPVLETVPVGLNAIDLDGADQSAPMPSASPEAFAAWLGFAAPRSIARLQPGQRWLFLQGGLPLLIEDCAAVPHAAALVDQYQRALPDGLAAAIEVPPPHQSLPVSAQALTGVQVIDNPAWHAPPRAESRISVVLPSFNHAHYIAAAIESVLTQSWPELELIIIDDGSTDDSRTVIEGLLHAATRPMRAVFQRNRGAHEAINLGLALARGDYIAILNSDDAYLPQRFARMMPVLQRGQAPLAFSECLFIGDDGQPVPDRHPYRRALETVMERLGPAPDDAALIDTLLRVNVAISTGNFLFRRELLDALGGFRPMIGNHDWDFILAACCLGAPAFVREPLYRYRLHATNTFSQHVLRSLIEVDFCRQRFFASVDQRWPADRVADWRERLHRSLDTSDGYDDWILDAEARAEPLPRLTDGPLISILLPVYNIGEAWLRRCLDSVLAQRYEAWELCIADDASTQAHVSRVLDEYARRSDRIRVVRNQRNAHISASSNAALALARGEFIALLDHDDELHPEALYHVAAEIVAHPQALIVYSDEDKVDLLGWRNDAYMKPDFDPHLLRAQNCISHLGVYRTEAVRAVGGFRVGFEGAQDWDLALRISEGAQPGQIRHVPRVLYHWRTVAGSTSVSEDRKDYVSAAQQRTLIEHLQRIGRAAPLLQPPASTFWWHQPALPQPLPPVVLAFECGPRLDVGFLQWIAAVAARARPLVREVRLLARPEHEGMLATPAARAAMAGSAPRVFVRPAQTSRASALAAMLAADDVAGASAGDGHVVVLLRDGVRPMGPDWLSSLLSWALLPDVGLVAAKVFDSSGAMNYAGTMALRDESGRPVLRRPYRGAPGGQAGYFGRLVVASSFSVLDGPCLVLDMRKLAQAGSSAPQYVRDRLAVEWSLRLCDAGLRNVWLPYSPLVAATGAELDADAEVAADAKAETDAKGAEDLDLEALASRWPAVFDADPAYNRNLTREPPLFRYALPPVSPISPVPSVPLVPPVSPLAPSPLR
ncbi:MAG: glycosyltransferase [Burkholderiaceae bacterium]